MAFFKGDVMRLFRPRALSREQFDEYRLKDDLKNIRKFGPAGSSYDALYINSFYLDRRFYIPYSAIQRVFKRVAMTKGGFTGKGMFATLSYLVVQYDGGKERQAIIKKEDQIDMLLSYINEIHPEIKTLSKQGEERLEKLRKEEEKRYKKNLSESAENAVKELRHQKEYIEMKKETAVRMQIASKRMRAYNRSKKSLKWIAFFIVLLGVAAISWGIYSLVTKRGDFGIYFTLFGLAAVFLFSGVSIIPTGKNNKRAIARMLEEARAEMKSYTERYDGFSIPYYYAHPDVFERTIRVIREGRAEDINTAFSVMKEDLKKINSTVKVSQLEYDEIVNIKPMFLLMDYK